MVRSSFFFRSAMAVLLVAMLAGAAEQSPPKAASSKSADVWIPVDASDWSVYMDAPAYHFNLAREYLRKGETEKAAAELREGNSFLIFQRNRISYAVKEIEDLSRAVVAGKEKNVARYDSLTAVALDIINRKYAMVPLEIEPASIFEKGYTYHFEKAKSDLKENNFDGAASEIMTAASFLRLKASHVRHIAKDDLDTAGNDLKDLASRVKAGTVKDVKELDKVFKKAVSVFGEKSAK